MFCNSAPQQRGWEANTPRAKLSCSRERARAAEQEGSRARSLCPTGSPEQRGGAGLGNQTGGPAGDWGAGSLHLSLGWTVGSAESDVTAQGQGMEKSTMLQETFWLKLPLARLCCGLSLLNKAFPFLLGFWRLSCFLVLSVRLAGSRGSGRCPPWHFSRPACAWQSFPPAGQCSPGSFCWNGAGHGSLSTANEELGIPVLVGRMLVLTCAFTGRPSPGLRPPREFSAGG